LKALKEQQKRMWKNEREREREKRKCKKRYGRKEVESAAL
jgi:hypothetical protein